MALITDKEAPPDIPTTDALADIDTGQDETPPAYLSFGQSPAALDEPPEVGEVRTYIVRARCTGEHGPIERKDGEMRYTRTMQIQWCHEQGKKPPADGNQPGLFDHGDEDQDGDVEQDGEQ
jgi:hypothetical protein